MPSINFKPPFIAHRGANTLAPENTLAAFVQAKALGAQWVEFDCMLAACGEVVVIHDESLDRTTNGSGLVKDYPYSYLKTLDAGSWFSSAYAGEKIPTLREVLFCLKDLGMAANIEIKAYAGDEDKTAQQVWSDIQACWDDRLEPPLISSFSVPLLQSMRQLTQTARLGLLLEEWFVDWDRVSDHLHCVSVGFDQAIATREQVHAILAQNRMALSYTVNDPARAQTLFDWGVQAVFTDDLRLMLTE